MRYVSNPIGLVERTTLIAKYKRQIKEICLRTMDVVYQKEYNCSINKFFRSVCVAEAYVERTTLIAIYKRQILGISE
jgi:hypothetical protein